MDTLLWEILSLCADTSVGIFKQETCAVGNKETEAAERKYEERSQLDTENNPERAEDVCPLAVWFSRYIWTIGAV